MEQPGEGDREGPADIPRGRQGGEAAGVDPAADREGVEGCWVFTEEQARVLGAAYGARQNGKRRLTDELAAFRRELFQHWEPGPYPGSPEPPARSTGTMKGVLLFGPGMGFTMEIKGQPQSSFQFATVANEPINWAAETPMADTMRSRKRELHDYKFDDIMSSPNEAEDVAVYIHSANCPCLTERERNQGLAEEAMRAKRMRDVQAYRYQPLGYGDQRRMPGITT